MRSRPLVYLTYGDVDSPVFRSQVIGFCDFLEESLEIPVHLVSFVPLRLYFQQRRRLGRYHRKVKVLPVVNRWQGHHIYSRFNACLVSLTGAHSVMTRNPVAVHVCKALQQKGWKYFYDARGCHHKELEEFSGVSSFEVEKMQSFEFESFRSADWVFSVSNALVTYFKEEGRYRDHNHSIVPCCYLPTEGHLAPTLKTELFGEAEVRVFCYAGALSVWNFPKSFLELCAALLKDPMNRLIILSRQKELLDGYPFLHNERVIIRSVAADEVPSYLHISDYAILLRKKAITNQVASPSKFGEYLAAGCKVIISPGIGDFTTTVEQDGLGLVYRGRKDNALLSDLESVSEEERQRIQSIAKQRFLRSSAENQLKYRNLKAIHDGETNA